MGNGGKGRTGKTRRRKAAGSAPPPAEAAAAPTQPADDEPAAPVGFRARDTAGDAKPEPAVKKRGGAGVAAVLVAAVAVVAVAGYLTRAAWLPKATGGAPAAIAAKSAGKSAEAAKPAETPSPPLVAAPTSGAAPDDPLTKEREQLRGELNRLIARLDGVEKSMDSAKKMIHATAPPADKLGGPSLERLSERVGELEKREAALKELAMRVERMEKTAAEGAGAAAVSSAQAVVLAVSGLNDAIARGEPFAKHLETLKAIGGGDPNVKATLALLSKNAVTGIPTPAALRDGFESIAGKIVRASKVRDDDQGWMARAADRIASLITWRRVGDGAKGGSIDAVVARAEARLKAGDLAGAVMALDAVAADKKAAAVAEAWLAHAKARITAERAVASLHVHVVSLLAPAKP